MPFKWPKQVINKNAQLFTLLRSKIISEQLIKSSGNTNKKDFC